MSVEPAADQPDDVGSIVQAATVADWFPLQQGNNWDLTNQTDSRFVEVDATAPQLAHVNGLFLYEDGVWLGWTKSNPNELFVWDDGAGKWRTFIRFGRKTGTTWQLKGGQCSTYDVKVLAKSAKVQTPAGEFKKAYRVGFTLKPSPTAKCLASFHELTFVEGVGLVSLASPAAEAPYVLKSAVIDGEKPFGGATLVTIQALEANPAAYDGQRISVNATPTAGAPICTKMACGPQNPCCNKCGSGFTIGTQTRLVSETFGCSGNECSLTCTPFAQTGNDAFTFTGTFTATEWGGGELAVESYQ